MAATLNNPSRNADRLIGWFLLVWTLLNILQATTLGLHSDTAYYWIYSRLLDWGYYDHPPMVAIFIRIGYSLIHQELGVRLMTVLTSTLSMYVLWLIAKRYKADARWFVLIVPGILIFHIYGFTTTPDAPLLFFTILFYYVYQRYLDRDSWGIALLLALVIACLLYSKYHAVLLIFFTLAANLKLLKRPSFWLIPVLAALLYVPHILWQIQHGYPSINYHLFERSSETYDFAHTYLYLPGQLLMAGPLIGWFLFYYAWGTRNTDNFTRCLLVNSWGTFLFFLINTLKGNVQPHWTLIGFVPLALLVLIRIQRNQPPKWFYRLAMVNLVVIVAFRLLLAMGLPYIKNLRPVRSYFGYPEWARQVHEKVGNAYVIMANGFQEPSKYNYYTRSLKGFSYDARSYRRTQYDLWPIEDSLQHQRAYYLSTVPLAGITTDTLHTAKGIYYGTWINDVRTYQRIDIRITNYKLSARPRQPLTFNLMLTNPYPFAVDFSNVGQTHPAYLAACFFQGEEQTYAQLADSAFNQLKIPAHQTATYTLHVNAPPKPGKYDLIFSLRTTPFPGGRNSRIVNFTVQ
ncbi:glycosyltransferase family 39 protein [Mucilaginibacter robiniae]|uniref:Glycosyltransferase family 39 protein n=1 Tax=Mucilaginibacter robiniae TaxID=2728022 RepID=A0A7L5E2H6_9SPHI|nr:glycosyltransferase family 39 protein [Mucilaginibacter robiniae]QJD95003.1 glycosyltransferase family 39 protein [Mucilaginibacter robiniae]